ncbi:MAG: acetate kinase [Clostridia bacterium]|nr:acetate kinase [Clostridia bacterium]
MKILVVNAGSSSLKYQLFDMDTGVVIAKGNCEKIGIDGSITHKRPGKEPYKADVALNNHDDAIALVLKLLTDPELGVLADISEIGAVGHRVAHGGERLRGSTLLDDAALAYLNSIVEINPLHGPPAIKGIEACRRKMPSVPQVGVFDTSFYSTVPEKAYIYPLPYELYEQYKIRRYGFHGTSHRYVSAAAAELAGRAYDDLKIIVCHIGNGSSITAIDHGRAVDTSMGFTPQEGLPMGTRSGTIDPTVVPYIMKKMNLTADEVEDLLNRKSGLLGVSGVSSDCRFVMEAEAKGDKRAALALDILVHYMKKIIGSYIAEMNGLDVLCFTAGIGENDADIRARVTKDMDYLGIAVDAARNEGLGRGNKGEISADGARVRTFVIPTDEEFMIAKDTYEIVTKS